MRVLSFTAALLMSTVIVAQDHFCGQAEVQNNWFARHPELRANYEALQRQAEAQDREFTKNKGNAQQRIASAAQFTVPIVFHILHTGGAENISDAQVLDQVSILNRDYRKLNADTNVVVNAFKSLIGDAKIEFRLATIDPNGNCTNGIIRHWNTKTDWDSNNSAYYVYTWDPTRYLNVYVVKSINSNAAGYTFLPGSGIPSQMDAIVILSTYVGSIGSGNTYTSRALTHEVGHWFNLPHTWGGTNQPGVACGDDGVSDTPVTKGFTSCNLNNSAICNPGVPENVQNYMDYSYCSKMFTLGQANRMQIAAANTVNGRNNISSPTNLANTGVTSPGTGCIPGADISASNYTICSGKSLNVFSYTFNANPTSYAWSANNGAVVANPSAGNTSVLFTNPGITNVVCTVYNGNGSVTKNLNVTVLNGVTDITTTTSESFEGGVLPPLFTVYNPTTPNVKWDISQDGAASGFNSMFVDGENLPANAIEILETPSYDFKNNPGAQFTFYYAYAKKDASNKDVFKVQASKDCGGTWVDIWAPGNGLLANNSGGVVPTTFMPGQSYWVMYDLQNSPQFMSQFYTEDNVRLRFYFQEDVGGSGYGNRFYLDDINFSGPVGINEITRSIGFNVYPNPSAAAFMVDFTLSQPAKIKYQVVSVTGAVMMSQAETTYSQGNHVVRVNENGQLAQGIYFLNFEMNGVKMSRKLVVN